jgi:DNA-directed RNA polymerase specialized sigma24 family protein
VDSEHPDDDMENFPPRSAIDRLVRGGVASANDASFSAIYRNDIHDLVRFLMKAVGASLHDAADTAQTAYQLAWEKWETLSKPQAWVRVVGVRVFYRSSPGREVLTGAPLDRPALLSLESCFEISERAKAAYRLLCALPPTQRIVLAWRTDGYSIEEIAEELVMEQAAVRQNIHRARAALKEKLEAMLGGGVA